MSFAPVPPHDPLATDQAEVADAAIQPGPVDYRLVHLAGVPIPVVPPIQFSELATLYPRLTIGDFTNASDNFFSVWVMNDWTGGGQVEEMREPSHANRYWTGTAETRYAGILAQPPETVSRTYAGGTGDAIPVGDYGLLTEHLYVAFGTKLCRYDATTDTFSEVATLAGPPVNKGVVYDDRLWIPLGPAGYATWDEATLTSSTTLLVRSFTLWADKLVALSVDGQVAIWDGMGWYAPTDLKLRGRQQARHLIAWWSPEGLPTLYIVTDEDVWAVDPDVPILMRTGLRFPRHPDQGLAAAVWRDDALYVSVGMGVHQMTIGSPPAIAAVGLDRDAGVPAIQRGAIVDFHPEYNGLFALVRGESDVAVTTSGQGPMLEQTMIYDDPLIGPATALNAHSSLFVYTQFGWHCLWESPDNTAAPTKVYVSQAEGTYRVWWGHGPTIYRQELPRAYHNPAQAALSRTRAFATESYLVTGQFDANLSAFEKIWSHFEAYLDEQSAGTVEVWYRTNVDQTWRQLGVFSGTGWQALSFDPDGDGWAEGEASHWIQFRLVLSSGGGHETPLVRWFALKYLVVPLQTRAWTFTVPLMHPEQFMGMGPDELFAFLDGLAAGKQIVPFKHNDAVYRVRVTRVVAGEQPGPDSRRVVTVTVAEAPLPEVA